MALARRWRLGLLLGAAALLLLPGAGWMLQLAYRALHRSFGLAVDLVMIGVLLFLIAAFFAPLEALGWWAGWFGEEMKPPEALGELAQPRAEGSPAARWVVYLDGIGQASAEALPEGEDFLRRLASALPEDIAIVRGIMPYSVVNQPITEGRWVARFWRLVDRLRLRNPRALLGVIINLRNVTVVAVSADKRYGPIYNRGIARVIAQSLLANGYAAGSSTPVTLLGFSGGGQIALGALPHLRRLLQAPVEVVSLAGVFAGSNEFLQADHLFHLVGERDAVERVGPVAFPGRWRAMVLSFWNRARRRGKVTLLSLGPVGHELPGGVLDASALLPDGRSHMEQTVDLVAAILTDRLPHDDPLPVVRSNYERFRGNPWQGPLPVGGVSLPPDPGGVRRALSAGVPPVPAPGDPEPAAPPGSAAASLPPGVRPRQGWIGRLLLLPAQQRREGVGFEVRQAPPGFESLRGRRLQLQWHAPYLRAVTLDVHLSGEALASVRAGGVHPVRLDGWRQVTPLESLAGAHPVDDVLVRLPEPVRVTQAEAAPALEVEAEPRQTTGVAEALVRFVEPLDEERWRVVPFDPRQRDFSGTPFVARLPAPLANGEGIVPATSEGLHRGALNGLGWYVSGVPEGQGQLLVQAMLPRALRRFAPERLITGRRRSWRYAHREAWRDPVAGTVSSVLLAGGAGSAEEVLAQWQPGDRLLVLHVYGGIGGDQREAALQWGICVGHFAYGLAQLVHEPLAGEPAVEVLYRQVYAHNPEGLIAGVHDRWRYLGDRQWGWLGTRPVADILIRFPPFTGSYLVGEHERSPLEAFERQLAAMMARYRIGDGTGAAFVGPANNCAQDSNQALFAAVRGIQAEIAGLDPALLRDWQRRHPEQARRLEQLRRLERALRRALLPFGGLRPDWRLQEYVLGSSLEDRPLENLLRGLGSWRTALPRLASDTVLRVFLDHGATALVQRTNQVGGEHPSIAPVAPLTLF